MLFSVHNKYLNSLNIQLKNELISCVRIKKKLKTGFYHQFLKENKGISELNDPNNKQTPQLINTIETHPSGNECPSLRTKQKTSTTTKFGNLRNPMRQARSSPHRGSLSAASTGHVRGCLPLVFFRVVHFDSVQEVGSIIATWGERDLFNWVKCMSMIKKAEW